MVDWLSEVGEQLDLQVLHRVLRRGATVAIMNTIFEPKHCFDAVDGSDVDALYLILICFKA